MQHYLYLTDSYYHKMKSTRFIVLYDWIYILWYVAVDEDGSLTSTHCCGGWALLGVK